jgi:hypothetical protein
MASRFKLAMALAGAISIGSHAWAADPPGAEPAQPLDERITNGPDDRTPPDRPTRRSGDTLDPLGPAQPEGLAPSATRPESEPEECRGLPRDARAACLENSNRGAEEPPVPQVPATPAEKASPASRPSGGTLKR